MSNVNNFLPFAPTDTGTNLLSQSAYAAAANRTIGNQPGIASSQLVNKAVRQSAYIASQIAQYVSNQAVVDVLDDATPAKLLSQIMATFQPLAPVLTNYISSAGNWNATFYFFISSGNATAAATYTNNGVTYTVTKTIAAGTVLQVTGNGAPSAGGGTLTKASGSGDATITFYAFRSATNIRVRMVGGGGGGAGGGAAGGGTVGGSGGSGGSTTFGSALLVANGGNGGTLLGGTGGTASLGTGPLGIALQGGSGSGGHLDGTGADTGGGVGACTPFGGEGGGSAFASAGSSAIANTGSGGGGGGAGANAESGGGGGAGGYVDALIISPLYTYAYSVANGGNNGSSGGVSGGAGGSGASGFIQVIENF